MADISDVTAYLKAQALEAVYPNGVGTKNSIANIDVRIFDMGSHRAGLCSM